MKYLYPILTSIAIFVIAFFFTKHCIDKTVSNQKIDSIKIENNKIKVEITKLDSIKNEEIEKVKTYSNDSTLIIFYQLIKQ